MVEDGSMKEAAGFGKSRKYARPPEPLLIEI